MLTHASGAVDHVCSVSERAEQLAEVTESWPRAHSFFSKFGGSENLVILVVNVLAANVSVPLPFYIVSKSVKYTLYSVRKYFMHPVY